MQWTLQLTEQLDSKLIVYLCSDKQYDGVGGEKFSDDFTVPQEMLHLQTPPTPTPTPSDTETPQMSDPNTCAITPPDPTPQDSTPPEHSTPPDPTPPNPTPVDSTPPDPAVPAAPVASVALAAPVASVALVTPVTKAKKAARMLMEALKNPK